MEDRSQIQSNVFSNHITHYRTDSVIELLLYFLSILIFILYLLAILTCTAATFDISQSRFSENSESVNPEMRETLSFPFHKGRKLKPEKEG